MLQIASLIGAALILLAFVGAQTERMTPRDRSYNLLNALGAGLLTGVAIVDQRAGFVLLEGTWTALSLWALWRHRDAEPAAQPGAQPPR